MSNNNQYLKDNEEFNLNNNNFKLNELSNKSNIIVNNIKNKTDSSNTNNFNQINNFINNKDIYKVTKTSFNKNNNNNNNNVDKNINNKTPSKYKTLNSNSENNILDMYRKAVINKHNDLNQYDELALINIMNYVDCQLMKSGYKSIASNYVFCKTCDSEEKNAICIECSKICHKDHKLSSSVCIAAICNCGLLCHKSQNILDDNNQDNNKCYFMEWSLNSNNNVYFTKDNSTNKIYCMFCANFCIKENLKTNIFDFNNNKELSIFNNTKSNFSYTSNKLNNKPAKSCYDQTNSNVLERIENMSDNNFNASNISNIPQCNCKEEIHAEKNNLIRQMNELSKKSDLNFYNLIETQIVNIIFGSSKTFDLLFKSLDKNIIELNSLLQEQNLVLDSSHIYSGFSWALQNIANIKSITYNYFYFVPIFVNIITPNFVLDFLCKKFDYKSIPVWSIKFNLIQIYTNLIFEREFSTLPDFNFIDIINLSPLHRLLMISNIHNYSNISEFIFDYEQPLSENIKYKKIEFNKAYKNVAKHKNKIASNSELIDNNFNNDNEIINENRNYNNYNNLISNIEQNNSKFSFIIFSIQDLLLIINKFNDLGNINYYYFGIISCVFKMFLYYSKFNLIDNKSFNILCSFIDYLISNQFSFKKNIENEDSKQLIIAQKMEIAVNIAEMLIYQIYYSNDKQVFSYLINNNNNNKIDVDNINFSHSQNYSSNSSIGKLYYKNVINLLNFFKANYYPNYSKKLKKIYICLKEIKSLSFDNYDSYIPGLQLLLYSDINLYLNCLNKNFKFNLSLIHIDINNNKNTYINNVYKSKNINNKESKDSYNTAQNLKHLLKNYISISEDNPKKLIHSNLNNSFNNKECLNLINFINDHISVIEKAYYSYFIFKCSLEDLVDIVEISIDEFFKFIDYTSYKHLNKNKKLDNDCIAPNINNEVNFKQFQLIKSLINNTFYIYTLFKVIDIAINAEKKFNLYVKSRIENSKPTNIFKTSMLSNILSLMYFYIEDNVDNLLVLGGTYFLNIIGRIPVDYIKPFFCFVLYCYTEIERLNIYINSIDPVLEMIKLILLNNDNELDVEIIEIVINIFDVIKDLNIVDKTSLANLRKTIKTFSNRFIIFSNYKVFLISDEFNNSYNIEVENKENHDNYSEINNKYKKDNLNTVINLNDNTNINLSKLSLPKRKITENFINKYASFNIVQSTSNYYNANKNHKNIESSNIELNNEKCIFNKRQCISKKMSDLFVKLNNKFDYNYITPLFFRYIKVLNVLFDQDSTVDETEFLSSILSHEDIIKVLVNNTKLYLPYRIELIKYFRMAYIDVIINKNKMLEYRALLVNTISLDKNDDELFNDVYRYKFIKSMLSINNNLTILDIEIKLIKNELINYEDVLVNSKVYDIETFLVYFEEGIIKPLLIFINKFMSIIYLMSGYHILNLYELVVYFLKFKLFLYKNSSIYNQYNRYCKDALLLSNQYNIQDDNNNNNNNTLFENSKNNNKYNKIIDTFKSLYNFNNIYSMSANTSTSIGQLLKINDEYKDEIEKDLKIMINDSFEVFNYQLIYSIYEKHIENLIDKPEAESMLLYFSKREGNNNSYYQEKKKIIEDSDYVNTLEKKSLLLLLKYENDKSYLSNSAIVETLGEQNILTKTNYRFVLLKSMMFLSTSNKFKGKYTDKLLWNVFRLLQYDTKESQQELAKLHIEKGNITSANTENINFNYLENYFLSNFLSLIFYSSNPSITQNREDYKNALTVIKVFKYLCEEHNQFFQTLFFTNLNFVYSAEINIYEIDENYIIETDNTNKKKNTINLFDYMLCILNKILILSKWDQVSFKEEDKDISYYYDLFYAIVELLIEMTQGSEKKNLEYVASCNLTENLNSNNRNFLSYCFIELKTLLYNNNNDSVILYKVRIAIIDFVLSFLEEPNTPIKIINNISNIFSPQATIESICIILKMLYIKLLYKDFKNNILNNKKAYNIINENLGISFEKIFHNDKIIDNLFIIDNILFNKKLDIFYEKIYLNNINFINENPEFELCNKMYKYLYILYKEFDNEEAKKIFDNANLYDGSDFFRLNNISTDKSNKLNSCSNINNQNAVADNIDTNIIIDYQQYQNYFIIDFFNKITKSIWISKENQLSRIIYTVNPLVYFLSDDTKLNFYNNVDRSNRFNKLTLLSEYSSLYFFEEIMYRYKQSKNRNVIYKLFSSFNYKNIEIFVFSCYVIINILLIISLENDPPINNYSTGPNNLVPSIPSGNIYYIYNSIKHLVFYMGIGLLFINFISILSWFITKFPLYYRIETIRYIRSINTKKNHNNNNNNNDEDNDHNEIIDSKEEANTNNLKLNNNNVKLSKLVKLKILTINTIFNKKDINPFILNLIITSIALISENTRFIFSFHLIFAINLSVTMYNITKAISLRGNQLLAVSFLGIILINIFANVGYFWFFNDYFFLINVSGVSNIFLLLIYNFIVLYQ